MTDPTGSNLRVPPELESAGSRMASYAETIESQLIALRNKLDPLKDYWQGPAQSYYQDLQHEWNVAADGLLGPNGVCGEIASSLNLAWNNYTDCEWANVKTWTTSGGR
ncbi:WXG100 family type VII secretion target [Micromonospora sp. CA-249363]|jgi:WXG100 family type VII secretion target|uniref:WXG100 family type VII secretion target n=1 Tax=unclassified Micromonospora TaxID=2617518 RepID=UPI00249A9811|nr:WXG100 family type VII secretion target [Micromonospora sp. WMMD1155]WFE48817.1 WXG100 family type VII secretion target [Micromonospora sp. WMMD1155]